MMASLKNTLSEFKVVLSHLGLRVNWRFKDQLLTLYDLHLACFAFACLEPLARDLFDSEPSFDFLFKHKTFDVADFCKEVKDIDNKIKCYQYYLNIDGPNPNPSRSALAARRYYEDLFGHEFSEIVLAASPVQVRTKITNSRYYEFYEPMLSCLEEYWSGNDYVNNYRRINTWLNFILRAQLKDIDLLQKQIDDYIEFESYLSTVTSGLKTDDPVTKRMSEILRAWIPDDFDYQTCFKPKHGPGAVQDRPGKLSAAQKHSYLTCLDQRVHNCFKNLGINLDEYFPDYCTHEKREWSRVSKIIGVPKALDKRRIISVEEASMQYVQQGIMSIFNQLLLLPSFKKHIDLSDQSLSQKMAQYGSLTGEYDTTDMSSASDSVTTRLTDLITADITWLNKMLLETRSEWALLPNGLKIPMLKFAAMGAGTCFRTECVVFLLAMEYSKESVHTLDPMSPNLRHGDYRAFGDDLITEKRLSPKVLETLRHLGFIPNMAKSFFGNPFNDVGYRYRESCGGEYLDGFDVTPLRIPRTLELLPVVRDLIPRIAESAFRKVKAGIYAKRKAITPALCKSYIDFCNLAFLSGCLNLRNTLLALIAESLGPKRFSQLLFVEIDFTTPSFLQYKNRLNLAAVSNMEVELQGILTFPQYCNNRTVNRVGISVGDNPTNWYYHALTISSRQVPRREYHIKEIKPTPEVYRAMEDYYLCLSLRGGIVWADLQWLSSDDLLYFEWLRSRSDRVREDVQIDFLRCSKSARGVLIRLHWKRLVPETPTSHSWEKGVASFGYTLIPIS